MAAKNDLGNRIREVRMALGLSQTDFAARLWCSRDVILNAELGRSAVKKLFLEQMAKEFSVNLEWLETGNGEMFLQLPEDEQIARTIARVLYKEPESLRARVISVVTRLSEDDLEVLVRIAKQIAEASED